MVLMLKKREKQKGPDEMKENNAQEKREGRRQ